MVGLVFLCVVTIGWLTFRSHPALPSVQNSYTLRFDAQQYRLEAAITPSAQAQGLGNRDAMPNDTGMIFVFPSESERCFWMKDMRFPLDIIWVSADKTVTRIESNLSPDTYPQSYCKSAQYVIELNAGEAQQASVTVGQRLDF